MGLGAYSGSNESMFGAKGPANFLTKITFVLGFVFVINTVDLGWFYNQEKQKSVVDNVELSSVIPQKIELPKAAPLAPITK